ncbi:tyrosine-type recombinase/integrase [Methylobacterium nodulans]|uniref:Integrase family protein n=1 Tax=Methylobacterium nodulans (strain LMG 21967 / CNCM I-2342 / ORS 2060) TaxID=460265 RepID=B8IIS8_METNO|nr:site-specific integrase [Methylobacterium nodulans]ACL59955.1 integrase family protein [Methylobacterium nodulans ORS 2060]
MVGRRWGEWWGAVGREVNKLSARRVQTLTEPGRHADGGGLYLVVDPAGGKRWVFLYRMAGRRREMGLGPVLSVPLARARELAAEARAQVAGGVDPIDARRAPPSDEPPPHRITFAEVAEVYMTDRERAWRNAAHRRQWRQTLEVQAASLWAMPVADVNTEAVLAVLRPIWHSKAETARRLRGRIERILDAARVAGHRGPENPARWKGHLDVLLPRAGKLQRGHHNALPYMEVPAFVAEIRQREAQTARALELLILTAARSGEVRGMTWAEVDLVGALWTVPKERMKAKRPHRVPLCARAVEILSKLHLEAPDAEGLIFPSRNDTVLSDMVFAALLRRAKYPDITAHGFRSSFRDWAADETDHPREVIEAALAHMVGDATERAYRRGDALAKRRLLMDDWGAYVCGGASAAEPPMSATRSP